MSTNEPQDQGEGVTAATLPEILRGVSWPAVAALAVLAALVVLGPRFGVDLKESGTALAAIIGAAGLHYGRQAAKQTNGMLDGRIKDGVRAVLAEELQPAVARGIAEALDAQPPAAYGRPVGGGASTSWAAPGTYSQGQ